MGNTGIEFNCENEQYFLKKTNQSLLEELFIVKKQQNVFCDTIKRVKNENINLKMEIDSLRNKINELKKIIEVNILKENNYIKANYHIEKNDLNKEIKIIDHLDNHKNELENNCAIYLNNQQINSPYIFQEEGEKKMNI